MPPPSTMSRPTPRAPRSPSIAPKSGSGPSPTPRRGRRGGRGRRSRRLRGGRRPCRRPGDGHHRAAGTAGPPGPTAARAATVTQPRTASLTCTTTGHRQRPHLPRPHHRAPGRESSRAGAHSRTTKPVRDLPIIRRRRRVGPEMPHAPPPGRRPESALKMYGKSSPAAVSRTKIILVLSVWIWIGSHRGCAGARGCRRGWPGGARRFGRPGGGSSWTARSDCWRGAAGHEWRAAAGSRLTSRRQVRRAEQSSAARTSGLGECRDTGEQA